MKQTIQVKDATTRCRDTLINELSKQGKIRNDIWMRRVWSAFSHFVMVQTMESATSNLADQLPEELRRAA